MFNAFGRWSGQLEVETSLTFELNKRVTHGLNFLFRLLCPVIVTTVSPLFSQDTVQLKHVEITATKKQFSGTGKKTEHIDSTLKSQFIYNSLGDVLSYNTPLFIKTYGSGAISSVAFRGGNASQTAILWNGFNMQNAMLGQADLSLLPAALFDDVEVEYGGSSALWGSGAVAGSVLLKNNPRFGTGLSTCVSLGGNSTGGSQQVMVANISKSKFISTTKLVSNTSTNKFRYVSSPDSVVRQARYAGYSFSTLMQEFKFMLGERHIVNVNAWFNSGQRQLPAYDLQKNSRTGQFDEAERFTADWTYVRSRFKSGLRAAVFNESINYNDTLADYFSKSNVQTKIIESDNYWQWSKNNRVNFGANATTSSAKAESYSGIKTQTRISFLAGNRLSLLQKKLLLTVLVRAEYFTTGALPLTGNISAECNPIKKLVLTLNAAKVYRQPTLNELYWRPGGNLRLKPEEGYTCEGSIGYSETIRQLNIYASGAAFSRAINNWILWLPGVAGNPSPSNLQLVWSRGTETTVRAHYEKNKFRFGCGLITSYVLSTVEADKQFNSNTLGKQLIYTPRYMVNANLSLGYSRLYTTFFHQYVGYRFTASDNSEWLLPYHVSSLKLNYAPVFKKFSLTFFASCNNMFNINYSIIVSRPMPLRYFEFGLTFKTQHNLKHKKQNI